jgi:uncharacterized protein with GYD domain
MPLFLMSMSWTNNGIKTLGNWPKRMKDTRAFAKKLGITIKEVYLTMGEHDPVRTRDWPI